MNTFLHDVLEKYFLIIIDFLQMIASSDVINELKNKDSILNIGIDTITHVFIMTLIKDEDINKAVLTSRKSIYYYLEYIEQIHLKLITNDLNVKDAVLFLYNKSFVDSCNNEDESYDIITDSTQIDINKLSKIKHIVHNLLSMNNYNFEQKKCILEDVLLEYLLLCINNNEITYILGLINERNNMDYKTYVLFLKEFFNYMNKNIQKVNSNHINYSNLVITNHNNDIKKDVRTFIKSIFT